MTTNIVIAAFGGARVCKTRKLYQWDYGQVLQFAGLDLPVAYTVHFSNQPLGEAKTSIGDEDGVLIPDEYLTTGLPVYAWLYLHTGDSDGETRYVAEIPVEKRAQPVDEPPTPVQQSAIDQAIAALNSAVEQTAQDVESADESAQCAATSATAAESWAVGGTGTRTGEDTDNAKHYAEVAQQGAEEAGYAWFDINDQTGEIMVTVTDNLSQDVSFAINETTGELEVIVA